MKMSIPLSLNKSLNMFVPSDELWIKQIPIYTKYMHRIKQNGSLRA